MTFEKDMQFLGLVRNEMKDGAYYSITLFDSDCKSPVTVNMGENDSNESKLDFLAELKFGDPVSVSFRLQPKDKLYRLQVVTVG